MPLSSLACKIHVTIDPGHGGIDPGAIAHQHNIQEKKIALDIAKYLKNELNTPKYHAILTRETNKRYLPLRQRLDIARKHQADLFISIHADAYFNTSAHGISIYTLSNRGATNEAARWLADKENHLALRGGAPLENKNPLLKEILIDLEQRMTTQKSNKIAQSILSKLNKHHIHLHHKTVEQAAFIVLKSPDIPSILVETGFVSNPLDAMHLNQQSYQKKIAHVIALAIKDYFKQYPCTQHMSNATSNTNHIITVHQRDTLYSLAKKYGISVAALKKRNHLGQNSDIFQGQRLSIPTT